MVVKCIAQCPVLHKVRECNTNCRLGDKCVPKNDGFYGFCRNILVDFPAMFVII